MPVYRVKVSGEPVLARFDGEEITCGFVKNEYVWAGDPAIAAEKAMANVKLKIAAHQGLKACPNEELRLRVEPDAASFNLLKLLNNDGFVFYKVGT